MIKVLIVDDQKTVQAVLQDYLESESSIEVIGCAANGQEALELVESKRPHLVLMDIEMPVLDGLTATRIITEKFVGTGVLILSVHDEDTYLNAALQVGAKGYLKKNTPAKELINAIQSAYKGYFQLGPGLLEKYLYKVSQSQSNQQEIEELKNVIMQQSQLLKGSNGNGRAPQNSRVNYPDQEILNKFKDKYVALEQKVYSVSYRIDELAKKIVLVQNFIFFLVLFVIALVVVITIGSI